MIWLVGMHSYTLGEFSAEKTPVQKPSLSKTRDLSVDFENVNADGRYTFTLKFR